MRLKNLLSCVVIPFILDVRLDDAQAGVTQEEGLTGFLHLPSVVVALIVIARRIQPFLSLVDRKVEFCLPMNKSFSPCWESFCFVRKNPNSCDCKSGDRTYVQFFGFATNTLNVKQNIISTHPSMTVIFFSSTPIRFQTQCNKL